MHVGAVERLLVPDDAAGGPPSRGPPGAGYRNANAITIATSTLTATMVPTLTAAHHMRSMRRPPSRASLFSHMVTFSRQQADGLEHDDHRDNHLDDGHGHVHDVEQPSYGHLRQPVFRGLRLGTELAKLPARLAVASPLSGPAWPTSEAQFDGTPMLLLVELPVPP